MKRSATSYRAFLLGTALAIVGALLPQPAHAQWSDVSSAQYGANRSWVDVTNQVRSMVRNGSLNFRVSTGVLGVSDPAPGTVKTLRLRVRDYNGQTRDYTYQENQQVSLRVGNSGPGAGPGYPPNRPGYPNQYKLRSDDQQRFDSYYTRWLNYKRTNNQGEVRSMEKRMYDVYSNYRIPNSVPFYQVASPNVAQPDPGWGGGGGGGGGWNNSLRILSARYGSGPRTMDVTSRLQGMVRNNSLRFTVNNDSMGGDPAPGQPKQVFIQYSNVGQQRSISAREGTQVSLP